MTLTRDASNDHQTHASEGMSRLAERWPWAGQIIASTGRL
jgi:hypothetical protein